MGSFDTVWEQVHREQEWGKYPCEEVIRFVARNFYKCSRPDTRLLDAGCGSGAATWFMAREGFSVWAFDGSETAVAKARLRLQEEKLPAHITIGDAAAMPYRGEFFNGIIDAAMIYANTVDNITAILKECHRVLKKGGRLFSTGLFKVGMTGYGTGEKLEENTYREIIVGSLAHRGTCHFFHRREITDIWSSAGFNNLVVDSLERTDQGGRNKIGYYMVEAHK